MDKLREVATLLRIPNESLRLYSENDDTYKRYTRLIRGYSRMAWEHHSCWWCREGISPGDWYEAHVYVARPAQFVQQLGRHATFWVEKRHYPECPDRLREYEEEMYAQWDREDRAREKANRKAA